jgi:hypothetical protein
MTRRSSLLGLAMGAGVVMLANALMRVGLLVGPEWLDPWWGIWGVSILLGFVVGSSRTVARGRGEGIFVRVLLGQGKRR